MKKIISILFLIFFANNSFAQEPCNDNIIMAVKGKWTKHPDANMKATNSSQIISRINQISKLFLNPGEQKQPGIDQ